MRQTMKILKKKKNSYKKRKMKDKSKIIIAKMELISFLVTIRNMNLQELKCMPLLRRMPANLFSKWLHSLNLVKREDSR